jgi:hypothetical protein
LRGFVHIIMRKSPTESVTAVVDNLLAAPMFALPGGVLNWHCRKGDTNETQAGSHMIDTEVVRLRQLRATALKARALAAAMDSFAPRGPAMFTRSAVGCWRIARLVTGRLRAHPYLSYQRDASPARAAFDRIIAYLLAGIADRKGQTLRTLLVEMKRVAREVDNARALTWSADLSDSLGRSQTEIRRLITEVEAGARREPGALIEAGYAAGPGVKVIGDEPGTVAGNWPYLAF